MANYVHSINLYDENNNVITLLSSVPYSPKKTCGVSRCHDYHLIEKGYHFQTAIYDKDAKDNKINRENNWPLIVSDSNTGTQFDLSYLSQDIHVDSIISKFFFTKEFGIYYPGGISNKEEQEDLLWKKSGNLEIDCLVCHAERNYNFNLRMQQIRNGNFKWAATVGAGFGTVNGKVIEDPEDFRIDMDHNEFSEYLTSDELKVTYNSRIFNSDGTVTMEIPSRPGNKNCQYCHSLKYKIKKQSYDNISLELKKINDNVDLLHSLTGDDIHISSGMLCVDCHKSDIGHQIIRGNESENNRRSETHSNLLSCRGCHASGLMGAPSIGHPGLPSLHLDKIACTTCHSGPLTDRKGLVSPFSISVASFTRDNESEINAWTPIYNIGENGKIFSFWYIPTYWLGKKSNDNIVPLFPSEIDFAFNQNIFTLDENISELKAKTSEEVLNSFKDLMKIWGNRHYKNVTPLYVANGKIYEADSKMDLGVLYNKLATPIQKRVSHNVRPARLALGGSGSNGCKDCHSDKAPLFFGSLHLGDVFSNSKTEVTTPLHKVMGYPDFIIQFGVLRESIFKLLFPWLIPFVVLLCLLHYITFGPNRMKDDYIRLELKRFTVFERWTHFFQMSSFLILTVTGLGLVFNTGLVGTQSIWTNQTAIAIHKIAGILLAFTIILSLNRWIKFVLYEKHDFRWLKMLGGYFRKTDSPSGKFNAGQKLFFWFVTSACFVLFLTGLLMIFSQHNFLHPFIWLRSISCSLHDATAFFLIPGVVFHFYLCTIATPGTFRGIFYGRVKHAWAKKHHLLWHDNEMERNREYKYE